MVVYAKVENDTTYCVVKQGDKVISKQPDDPFGTLCWLTCSNLFDNLYRVFKLRRRYQVPAVSTFFTPFDVEVIKKFDLEWFVDEVLPAVKGKTNIEKIAEEYRRFDFATQDLAVKYEIYDWIVQVYVELRKMKWPVGKLQLPTDVKTQTIMEALANLQNAQFVTFPAGTESLLPALRTVHPNAKEVDGVWVCHPEALEKDPFGLEDAPIWLSEIDKDFTTDESASADLTEKRLNVAEDLSDTIKKVLHVLTTPQQHLSTEHVEFTNHGGNPDIIDKNKGGLGKNKLLGLGKICGVGPLQECIDRLANHLKLSLPNFTDAEIYNLAAGRIAKMSSEKRPVRKEGAYWLESRN